MSDTTSTLIPKRPSQRRWMIGTAVGALGMAGVLAFLPAYSRAETKTPPPITLDQHAVAPAPSFADMVAKVSPAVVSVKVILGQSSANDGDGMPGIENLPPGIQRFFRQFGDQQGHRMQPGVVRMGQGSGFFITPDGEIVTNNHVVQGATDVEIVTNDGRTLPAKVIGTDPRTDLALLKVKEKGVYPYVQLGTTPPRVGDWVVAVGNPFGLGGTVTAGIVSARGRDIGSGPYDDYLQIDAPVNKGNSGGPSFTLDGKVAGVNTAIYSPSGGSVGIGFAIPASTVERVVAALRSGKPIERGFIGVSSQPVSPDVAAAMGLPDTKGALIAAVTDDSPGAKAGLKRGDLIVAVNGDKIDNPRDLARKIGEMKPGQKATLQILHRGKEQTVSFDLGQRPPEKTAQQG